MSRVLVVDDEPAILRAVTANLRARGFDADSAATGEDALLVASQRRPDAVILDLGLPGMSGLEVIDGLRGWTEVPIIVLSARGAERDKVAALDAGADDYLTKPFGMDELFARLRAALRRTTPAPEAPLVTTADFTVDLAAKIIGVQLVKHSEPIVLIGIPDAKVKAMVAGYIGVDLVAEAASGGGAHDLNIISGATVTVMVIDDSIVRSGLKVARALGLGGLAVEADTAAKFEVNPDVKAATSWSAPISSSWCANRKSVVIASTPRKARCIPASCAFRCTCPE